MVLTPLCLFLVLIPLVGFQIKFKLKGKWKIKTFNSTKTVTKAIKKLKKGKYSVQLRAFAAQNGKKVCSAWSNQKKVKVK